MAVVRTFGQNSAEAAQRERQRLTALEQLDMLDTPRDEGFERLVRLIKSIFTVDIALVSFIDAHRQWYKACSGLPTSELPREDTFCQYVVQSDEPMVITDTTRDPRFASHPAVTGDSHVRFYAGVPLKTREGYTVGTVCAIDRRPRSFSGRDRGILEEIASVAIDRIELLHTASTDSLTGALTRRAFKEEAERLLSLATRHQHDVACITLDIDHFKKVNDTHGHAAGDEVLKYIASTCRTHLRSGDLFGRQGGEEFAILLPHISKDDAVIVAEKLRQAIGACAISLPGGLLQVTASLGITTMTIVARNVETLLAQADAAMYGAKAAGRNRCILWSTIDGGHEGNRRRVLKAGNIIFNERRSTLNCTIRALGSNGATLSISSTAGIPNEFTLAMPTEGFESRCRVIAQDRQHIEVRFD